MNAPRPQSRPASPTWRWARRLALLALLITTPPAVASDETTYPAPEGPEVFGVDTPLGRVAYRAGRGLRVGDTGFTLGGFTTAEVEKLQAGGSRGGIEGVNFFLIYDPLPFVHVFSELEVGDLAILESGQKGIRSDPKFDVDRLYIDLGRSDRANLRFGTFLTPVGQWNQVLAEPLVWTTSEPLIVEHVFDETTTGAMLWGTVFPRGGALTYQLYGAFLEPISPDEDMPPAKRSVGGRLEWARGGSVVAGASYLASQRPGGRWNNLGGVDATWRPHDRLELTGESVVGRGSSADGFEWGLYTQAVVETVPTLYVVGRYEHFDPPTGRTVNLFDLGLAWVPVYYLRLKADYRFAGHVDELSAPGFRASFSILF